MTTRGQELKRSGLWGIVTLFLLLQSLNRLIVSVFISLTIATAHPPSFTLCLCLCLSVCLSLSLSLAQDIVIVIVNWIFLQRPQKRSRGNHAAFSYIAYSVEDNFR